MDRHQGRVRALRRHLFPGHTSPGHHDRLKIAAFTKGLTGHPCCWNRVDVDFDAHHRADPEIRKCAVTEDTFFSPPKRRSAPLKAVEHGLGARVSSWGLGAHGINRSRLVLHLHVEIGHVNKCPKSRGKSAGKQVESPTRFTTQIQPYRSVYPNLPLLYIPNVCSLFSKSLNW